MFSNLPGVSWFTVNPKLALRSVLQIFKNLYRSVGVRIVHRESPNWEGTLFKSPLPADTVNSERKKDSNLTSSSSP